MPLLRRAIALVVCGVLWNAAAAEGDSVKPNTSWLARSWQSDEGLPDNTITGVAQIGGSYLWLGTLGGPVSFDGARFRELPIVPIANVPNRVVRALYVDSEERLWLGMDRGALAQLTPGGSKTFTTADGLPDELMTGMAESADGALWIAYANIEGLVELKAENVHLHEEIRNAPRNGSWALARDARGTVWFSKNGMIGFLQEHEAKTVFQTDDAGARVLPGRNGRLWIFANGRLFSRREGESGFGERASLGAGENVRATALLEDREGSVWIGAAGRGLYRFDGTGFEIMPTSHRTISCLTEDNEGNIWVGTAGGGINRLRPRPVELLNLQSGLPFEAIRSVCQDKKGNLWVASQNGALGRQEGGRWINVSAQPNWPGGLATAVAADHDGAVWIGTEDRGLRRYANGQFESLMVRDGLLSHSVRALHTSSRGELWICYDGPTGLQRLRDRNFTTIGTPSGTRFLRAVAEDREGRIWIGASDGQLFEVQNDRLIAEPNTQQRIHSIRALATTPDGALWIGYAGIGLGRLKDGKLARVSSQNGLYDTYISQVVADDHGWLWLGSNRGIFQVRLRELEDFYEGRVERVRSIVYGKGENLPSLQASFDYWPGAFRAQDGRLWMPARTGLAVIRPDQIRDDPKPPKVLIESIAIDARVTPPDDANPFNVRPLPWSQFMTFPGAGLKIPPRHHKVDFDFTALSFTAPDNIHFKYRLEGVDPDWVEAGGVRHASYTLLPARDYKFRVVACNHVGVWSDEAATFAFTVTPFFWQTWLFRISMLLAFSALLVAAARAIFMRRARAQMRLLEQQAALHKERARIAKDIHDDLGASLTEIALLTEIAQQDAPRGNASSEYFNRIAGTARHVIKSLDEIVWAVNPRNDTLADFIDYTAQFALDHLRVAGIRCRLDLPEVAPTRELSSDVRHNLFLAAKEALHNVVKHSGASEAWVRIAVSEEGIRIVVEDNGRGFEFAPESATADGLRNMENRLRDIGGAFKVQSQLQQGSKAIIELPWPKK